MKECGVCNGTVGMIELNEDEETYTIHFHDMENSVNVKVNLKTLEKLSDAIQIQLFMRREIIPVIE